MCLCEYVYMRGGVGKGRIYRAGGRKSKLDEGDTRALECGAEGSDSA